MELSQVSAEKRGTAPLWTVSQKVRKYRLIAETSLQSNMAYAANFASDTVFYAFVVFVLISLWRTVYASGQPISDYSATQMMWYCVVTEMAMMSRSNVFRELSQAVQSGSIAYALNKPYNYLLYQFADAVGLIAIKLALNAAVGLAIGMLLIGPLPGFTVTVLASAAIALLGGITLQFSMQACLGLTAFWLEENSAFYWIHQKLVLVLGLMAPIEFLPDWLERVVRFLPFSYVTYGPARLAVAFSWERFAQTVIVQCSYIAVFALLAGLICKKGVKALNVHGG